MAIASHPSTYDALVDFPNEGRRYDIISVAVLVSPTAVPEHQDLLIRHAALHVAFVQRHTLGNVYPAPIEVCLADQAFA